jgi:hypothetical protein
LTNARMKNKPRHLVPSSAAPASGPMAAFAAMIFKNLGVKKVPIAYSFRRTKLASVSEADSAFEDALAL